MPVLTASIFVVASVSIYFEVHVAIKFDFVSFLPSLKLLVHINASSVKFKKTSVILIRFDNSTLKSVSIVHQKINKFWLEFITSTQPEPQSPESFGENKVDSCSLPTIEEP